MLSMDPLVRRLGCTALAAAFVLITWAVAGRRNTRHRRSPVPSLGGAEAAESVTAWRSDPNHPLVQLTMASPAMPSLVHAQPPAGGAPRSFDTRSFERMAQDWEREADDPDWSLNVRTFIGAILDTVDHGADAQDDHGLGPIAVRCRVSACRIDLDAEDAHLLRDLFESSREQQSHLTYEMSGGDAALQVEAYLSRQRGEPGDTE